MDKKESFLLFSNAKGSPPSHIGREAGFELGNDDIDSDVPSSAVAGLDNSRSGSRKHKVETERLLEYSKRSKTELRGVTERLNKLLDKRDKESDAIPKNESNALIVDLCKAQDEKKKLCDVMLSPDSKEAVMNAVDKKIRGIGKRIKMLNEEEVDEE